MNPIKVEMYIIQKIREAWMNGESDFSLITPDGGEVLRCKIKEPYVNGRKVRCSEDNITFFSIKEAADYYNTSPSHIRSSLRDKYRCRGKHFHYYYNEKQAAMFDEWVKEKNKGKGGIDG